jgi:hypothetical protein
MSVVVDKTVRIAEARARRLEQMAAEYGETEDALIEEGLDLLFRKLEQRAIRAGMMREDRELLAQMEAEFGPIQRSDADSVSLEGARLIVGTAVSSGWTPHFEEQR